LCDFCNDGKIKHWANCIGIVVLIILWEWCVCYSDEFVFRNDQDPLEAKCLGIRLFLREVKKEVWKLMELCNVSVLMTMYA
jgi:hypothetical protein